MSNELVIATLLSRKLGLAFSTAPFPRARWGKVDAWLELSADHYLFVEVEEGQHHPTTNVLKVWPYLEENPEASVVLVQVFFLTSRSLNSSRGRLAAWLGAKLQTILGDRFSYHRLVVSQPDDKIDGLEELQVRLNATEMGN